MTSSLLGSYTRPLTLALAKQIGHVRLQRFVRSMLPSAVWLVCSWQMPQSRGQTSCVVNGLEMPGPSPNSHFSAFR